MNSYMEINLTIQIVQLKNPHVIGEELSLPTTKTMKAM